MKQLKTRTIVFIVISGLIMFLVAGMGYGVYSAVKDAKSAQTTNRGGQTKGNAPIKAVNVKKADIEGKVVIPESSPQAQALREAEREAMEQAKQKARPHLPKVRVVGGEGGASEDAENNDASAGADMPSPNQVNERGQEIVDANSRKAEEERRAANGDATVVDGEQGSDDSGTFGEKALREAQVERANDLRDEELQAKLAKAKINRLQQEEALRLQNAKSLFSGLAFVPPSKQVYKFTAPSEVGNPYASGATAFSFDSTVTDTVSALVRTDKPGATRFGQPHPNYQKQLNEQISRSAVEQENANAAEQEQDRGKLLVEAGKTIYAHLTLPIDSDAPGPVRYEIDQGLLRKSIGFGSFRLLSNDAGIGLQATSIIYNGQKLPVNAWVINPSTELPKFDENIDKHYFYRFAGLAAGGFFSGFINSLVTSETVPTNGGSVVSTGRIEDARERVIYSIGTAAQGFMPLFYDMAKRPVTVKVPKGQPIGILFMDAVYENPIKTREYEVDLKLMNDALASDDTPKRVELTPEPDNKLALWQ